MRIYKRGWKLENLDARIMELWDRGLDTTDIAKKVSRQEFEVYNRIWHLRNIA